MGGMVLPVMVLSDLWYFARTGFITDLMAKSSETFVVKAGGEKGSEAYRCRSRTFFADNADPRASQPIAARSSCETSSNKEYMGYAVRCYFCDSLDADL